MSIHDEYLSPNQGTTAILMAESGLGNIYDLMIAQFGRNW